MSVMKVSKVAHYTKFLLHLLVLSQIAANVQHPVRMTPEYINHNGFTDPIHHFVFWLACCSSLLFWNRDR